MTFVCKYRNSGMGGNDPQECAWPQCGCDPDANRVLGHIEDSGCVIIDRQTLEDIRARLALAEEHELVGVLDGLLV